MLDAPWDGIGKKVPGIVNGPHGGMIDAKDEYGPGAIGRGAMVQTAALYWVAFEISFRAQIFQTGTSSLGGFRVEQAIKRGFRSGRWIYAGVCSNFTPNG